MIYQILALAEPVPYPGSDRPSDGGITDEFPAKPPPFLPLSLPSSSACNQLLLTIFPFGQALPPSRRPRRRFFLFSSPPFPLSFLLLPPFLSSPFFSLLCSSGRRAPLPAGRAVDAPVIRPPPFPTPPPSFLFVSSPPSLFFRPTSTFISSRRLLSKWACGCGHPHNVFSPFFNRVITRAFSSEIITKYRRKPIKHLSSKIKKSSTPKSNIKKPNAEPKVYSRERITKIYNILRYSTWDSAQEQMEKLCINWDSYTVTQVLKTHPPMEKSWLFFNWASGRKNFKHDQYTYTTMLDIFGEARRISSMMYVFKQMKEKGIKIDVVTYTSMMHWMSNDGDVDGAIDLWKEMRAKGCRPTVVSYTAYMKILFNNRKANMAGDVYKEMLESGLSPNCHTYTVLMEYLASSGKFKQAMEIFNKMQEAGVQPDKATCNILIEICCREGEIRTIVKILEYMKENFLVLRYPIFQKALESFKIAEECDTLLWQVNRHFAAEYSNEGTRKFEALALGSEFGKDNTLVLNLMDKQNLVAVDSLLADMIEKGFRLDSQVISKVIEVNSACHRQNGALLAYDYSMKLGINIERTAYLALIGLSIRVNHFHKVVEIVEKMVEEGLSLGTYLNSLLIYRLGCSGEATSAAKVFDVLPDKEKSTAEYTALIGAYFCSGDSEKGLETFKVMEGEGVNVALGTYCVLVAGLEKCSKARDLEYYTRKKKRLQIERFSPNLSMEETTCNLLFAQDFITNHPR